MDWGDFLSKAASFLGVGEMLLDGLVSHFKSEASLLLSVEEEVKKLRRTVEWINALLVDAEERSHMEDESFKLWLRQLKAVSFDADDLLDRYGTQLQVSKLTASGAIRKRKRSWLSIPDPVLLRRRAVATQIAGIHKRRDEITKSRKDLRLRPEDRRRRSQARGSSHISQAVAYCDRTQILGRDDEVDGIVRTLTSSINGPPLPVLPIYGAAGIGKTTIAKLVYNHSGVQSYFDSKIWVCLSPGCDVMKATKEMIEAITLEKCELLSLDVLQRRLTKLLDGRRFLLVIDNLWAEDFDFWDQLRLPLLAGEAGSKVLITTQIERVWRRIPTLLDPVCLKGLPDRDCWLLLRDRAFATTYPSNWIELEPIGQKIAEKCRGSPTAAKALGALLADLSDGEDWMHILGEMQMLEEDGNGVLPRLQISYRRLSYHLKLCFAYCSIFPCGQELDKDGIVRLWMANDLIPDNGGRRREATARQYFDELVWRSFIDASSHVQKPKYRMSSLMYDLARLVSKHEFVSLKPDLSEPEPKRFRYASLVDPKEPIKFEKIIQYQNLRTLKLFTQSRVVALRRIPQELFLKLSHLRALDLSYSDLEELPSSVGNLIQLRYLSLFSTRIVRLPESGTLSNLINLQTLELGKCCMLQELSDSVGDLIHLRYLGLSGTRIKSLPESVSGLSELQTVELGECYELQHLPRGMSMLANNLRHLGLHLDWDKVVALESMPCRIGRLTSLQTLSRFTVTSECNINQLKDLKLRGELCILNLENVSHVGDAEEANLRGKQHIEELMLMWKDQPCANSEQVIECLRPHNNLKHLRINNYPGNRFPDWIEDQSFTCLDTVTLSNCKNCSLLPLLGRLPRLKHLHVEGMHEVQSMENHVGFPWLEILTLWDLPKLERWFSLEVDIPRLRELSISHCPKLHKLTCVPRQLTKLEIRNCGFLEKWCRGGGGGTSIQRVPHKEIG